MRGRRPAFAGRDQDLSPFGATLGRLCDGVGALGAALVDVEGECVDYAGSIEPFDLKVMAAEWCVVIDRLRQARFPEWSLTHALCVRARRGSFTIFTLSDGYALVVRLVRYAFRVSQRAACEAIRELCQEAALEVPAYLHGESWVRVQVREADSQTRRPLALWVDGGWCPVVVLGRYAGRDLLPREIGYRARLTSGAELTVIRERLGHWFADSRPGH